MRPRPLPLLLLLSLLPGALPACAVDGEKDVRAWRDVVETGVPAPADGFDPAAPLALRRALEMANAGNETLAIAGEDYVQALVAKDRAAAAFLPTVGLAPTYARQDETSLGGGGAVDLGAFVPNEALDVPATARLAVNPPRAAFAASGAGEEASARRAELLDRRASLLVDVARTFYAVRIAERRLEVLTEAGRTARQRVRDLENRRAVGAAAPLAVARARADAAKVDADRIDAENAVANGRATLAFLVGVPAVDGELADDLEIPAEAPPAEEIAAAARERRRDLAAARARTRAAEEGLKAAFSEFFPSLSIDFTYFFSRESFPPDVDWRGVLGVDLPIFTAGRIRDDIRAAYSRLRQAKAAESLLSRRIGEQVANARRDFADSARRLETLGDRVAAAAEAERTSTAARENGLATDLDVLLAQDALREARLALATEGLARKLRWLLLHRFAGDLEPRLFPAANPGENR